MTEENKDWNLVKSEVTRYRGIIELEEDNKVIVRCDSRCLQVSILPSGKISVAYIRKDEKFFCYVEKLRTFYINDDLTIVGFNGKTTL